MPLSYRVLSPPATEPVSLLEAKAHLRVDFDDDDALILGYISVARDYCEKQMDRSIFARQMRLSMDFFPMPYMDGTTGGWVNNAIYDWFYRGVVIRLPKPATVSVDSIKYVDDSGTQQTLDPKKYNVDLVSEPARIAPAPGFTWPALQNYLPGAVTVDFTSGTWDTNTLPWSVKAAILLVVGHLYENREQTTEANLKTLPLGVDELLAGHRFETVYGAF